ncbi:exonuclease SbcCD subunit D [Paenibacillus naphthalenovorans]|uniref:Nuclease SbcCD subunit D n=1 Tax=Paenibacillus naphthalenovorans TaxID=162209 RepID=A0A0U2VCL1_9BACL|nr:exonuclease SbcCD subunit D [Paenibacillus naphthalenovorans]ALS21299.1 subunit D of exonuclease SbcCD [Paenibacillus naphthalenovorans]GCL72554.1 exonuclease sbcCD subunit D [Paenibacillus naphthalenovorans]SDH97609.1 exonuclease SbcD [Paenibacillus naphthalenovorans]
MRVLHTADWHFGRTLEGRSRLPEQEAFIDELAAIVRDQQIDLVLVAGDIYDSVNPPAAAEQLFYDALARLSDQGSRPVYVIAGNHDHPDRLAAAAPLALKLGVTLVGLPEARVYKSAIKRTGETAIVFALPYPSESRLRELLSDEAEEGLLRSAYSARVKHIVQEQARHYRKDTVNLLMSHLYVLGGKETESERPIQVGGAYTVDTEALTAGAQYVALGHLHRPQYIRSGTMIRYSGSPLAYSFSEAGQAKSVTILDIKPGSVPQVEEIFLSSGRPLVEWKAKGGLAEVHRWLDEGKDPTAWIDLEIHLQETMSLEQIHKLRQARDGFLHIRPVYPELQPEAMEPVSASRLPMDELFRRFYERQTGGAQPEPELVRLFLELLAEEDDAAV